MGYFPRNLLLSGFLGLTLFSILPRGAGAEEPSLIVRIETRFKDPNGFTCRFQQETSSLTLGRGMEARGVLSYSPGRILWVYEAPDPATYYLTKEEFLWVQPEERQVLRIPLEKAFVSEAPVFLLRGLKDLGELFHLKKKEKVEEGKGWRLTLVPRNPIPQVESLELLYEPQGEWVEEIRSHDPAGGMNTFRFSHCTAGSRERPVAPVYKIPPEYRVVTAPELR